MDCDAIATAPAVVAQWVEHAISCVPPAGAAFLPDGPAIPLAALVAVVSARAMSR